MDETLTVIALIEFAAAVSYCIWGLEASVVKLEYQTVQQYVWIFSKVQWWKLISSFWRSLLHLSVLSNKHAGPFSPGGRCSGFSSALQISGLPTTSPPRFVQRFRLCRLTP